VCANDYNALVSVCKWLDFHTTNNVRHTTPGMFADDTYITTADEEISTIECSLNSDLIAVHNWLKTNKLSSKYF